VKRWPLFTAALSVWACSSESSQKQPADTTKPAAAVATKESGGAVDLTGAGATFPAPLYTKWFNDYAAKTGVKINYQSLGSGAGIQQVSQQTVDFGASDAPMTDDEMAKAKGGPILHIPTVVGLVVIAYNLPGVTQPLRLSGSLIADIFLGKVTKWNDPRLVTLNQGAKLPAADILVVHRSDGSGTTYIFSDYLSAVSPTWKAGPGKGKDLQWPVGMGGKGNEGVAGQVKQTPNALGYTELAYAQQNKLSTALVQNAAGTFVAPTAEAATAAADDAASKLPPNTDYRVSIVNGAGASAYPITSFTWLLVYKNQPDPAKAKKLADVIRWALTDGEKDAAALAYAPLPASLVAKLTPRIDSLAMAGSR
jgi:phosphate transport system substrate-binding protein